MGEQRRFHRPTFFGPAALDAVAGGDDPADRHEAAFATARLLVVRGRASEPEAVQRLVQLGDDFGVDLLAELWAEAPADSLPGALWRLYALRAWIRGNPQLASREFDLGRRLTPVLEVVAGVRTPPGPDQVVAVADEILHGLYEGDFAVALDRAAAFCRIVAVGRASGDVEPTPDVPGRSRPNTAGSSGPRRSPHSLTDPEALSAARLVHTAEELELCSRACRDGHLQGMH